MKTVPHLPAACCQSSLDLFADMDRLCRWRENKKDSLCFSVTARLDASLPKDLPAVLAEWAGKGLKMIQWQWPKDLSPMPSGLLWQTAKAGIWNHVSGPDLFEKGAEAVPARFIRDNPHVVHSFDLPDDRTRPAMSHAYDDIEPLPGNPFWQTLSGSGEILSYLARYPASLLARFRWDQGTRMVLGNNIDYYYVSPPDLPSGYLDKVWAMVLAGGSVDPAYVRSNLEKAFLIGYAMENRKIVGCSCLKHPRAALIERLKKATGLDFSGCVERGYTSVRPEYRSLGVGRQLLEGLTARAGKYKVFAIIDEANLATRKMAQWNNTRKITTYFSEKTNKQMGIWMPVHMMPDPENQKSARQNKKKDTL
jgi:GNAT superfamily N-acetyltransferase